MYADLFWDRDETEHQKFLDNLAPIVLFTYNRLEHTRQTIEALKANVYAAESRLFVFSDAPKTEQAESAVFSDAPKTEQAESAVRAVREYLHSLDGFKEIQVIERTENWGLARNIMDGVTNIVNQYGKIIVLEDDIVTSKWFLKYMNDALKIYENESRVMEISGFFYPVGDSSFPETFFLQEGSSWGWGTWERAWKYFKREPLQIKKSFTDDEIYHFTLENENPYQWAQVEKNCDGRLYTWAVFWDVAIFRMQGLCLYSRESLIKNIGWDVSGEHCGGVDIFHTDLCDIKIEQYSLDCNVYNPARDAVKRFYHKLKEKKTLVHRVVSKLKRLVRGE